MSLADSEFGNRGMVKESLFAGRVVLLAVIAIVLAVYALNLAWYQYSYKWTDDFEDGREYSGSGYFRFYSDHVWDDSRGTTIPYSGNYREGFHSLEKLFSTEKTLISLWVLAGLLFIGLVLMDSRFSSVVTGCFLFGIGTLAIVSYIFNIGHAVWNANLLPIGAPEPGWMTGHSSNQFNYVDYTYSVSGSYGSQSGFTAILVAYVLQTIAFFTRAYVVMPSAVTDWNEMELEGDIAESDKIPETTTQDGTVPDQSRTE